MRKNITWTAAILVSVGVIAGLVFGQATRPRFAAERRMAKMIMQAALPGGSLNPTTIPKYASPLRILPPMPTAGRIVERGGKNIPYYEVQNAQFPQQVLPPGYPQTTVWGYGVAGRPATFSWPGYTFEAKWGEPIRVKWINGLMDPQTHNYLPHLFAVDQMLHWANPPAGIAGRDTRGTDPSPYRGPVPMVTHFHGGHTPDESDGYPEAWFLPAAANIPAGYAQTGTWYDYFKAKFQARTGVAWEPGTSIYQYTGDQRATTLWYHDHAMGLSRLNIYAGLAGLYILRGGPDDMELGYMPPQAYQARRSAQTVTEIPMVIQDRSFNADGSLFFPDNRAFFEGLNVPPTVPFLDIPFKPNTACDGRPSDISGIYNPEFFGNTMVVNGATWPAFNVEARRYRLRILDACNARSLWLRLAADATPADGSIDDGNYSLIPGAFWQIGSDGGFLPMPQQLDHLLLGMAERMDVIVDFTGKEGQTLYLVNLAPDFPFGGGQPGIDFPPADPATTGQVMKFVVGRSRTPDRTTPPAALSLPAFLPIGPAARTRSLTLNELDSSSVRVVTDASGNVVLACSDPKAVPFGPAETLLGILDGSLMSSPLHWMDPVTENPDAGGTEIWELYNFTQDGHPIHVHLVQFQVVNREQLVTDASGTVVQPVQLTGNILPPNPWETGFKDTVIALPGYVTRLKANFDRPGRYVWHCHIIDHEDNEMMRPYHVGPINGPRAAAVPGVRSDPPRRMGRKH